MDGALRAHRGNGRVLGLALLLIIRRIGVTPRLGDIFKGQPVFQSDLRCLAGVEIFFPPHSSDIPPSAL